MIRKLHLSGQIENMRLDQFLAIQLPDYSRSYLQKLIKSGKVQLDDDVVLAAKTALPANGVIKIELPEVQNHDPLPAAEEFLLYQNEND